MPSTPDSPRRAAPLRAWQRPWPGLVAGLAVAAGLLAPMPVPASGVQASAAAGPVEARRMLRGPTLIALLPPAARVKGDEGVDEAVAHVHFALTETQRCLGGKAVRLEFVYADRLTLVAQGKGEALAPSEPGDGIAMVLAEPGRAALLVQAAVGPSALQHLLPQAVFEFWQVPACRRE